MISIYRSAKCAFELGVATAAIEASAQSSNSFRTDALRRVRIGVGRPGQKDQLPTYVVTAFSSPEKPVVERACADAANQLRRLLSLGQQEKRADSLRLAVAAQRGAIRGRDPTKVPLLWATSQNNLGRALRELGELESDPAKLNEAIGAYNNALTKKNF